MATHAQNIENLRTAVYGEQVRGSMIELFEEDYGLVKDGVMIGTDISSSSDPTTGYHDGCVYINNAIWEVFKLEGTAWSDKGSIVGPQGASVTAAVDNGDGTFYLTFSNGTRSNNIATIRGETGARGPKGDTGDVGPQGRSVTSMTMTGTGKQHTVIATYSDGVSQTVGVVQDGADGSGTGDMSKTTYDPSDNGYVDYAGALTDGTNTMPYSTVANKADSATSLAGYGIIDAYTKTECDNRFMELPDEEVEIGKIATSDGSSGFTWEDQIVVDQVYNSSSANPQSGVAVATAISNEAFKIIRTGVTAAANSDVIIPAPTISGNTVEYNQDPRITNNSVIIPVADTKSDGSPIKVKGCEVTAGYGGGYVTITLAEAISNKSIGIAVIN